MAEANSQPKGFGGWLILPAIGLFLMPIRTVSSILNDLVPIFRDGGWEILTTPGSEAYHHLWAPLLIFESVSSVFFLIFSIYLICLFFEKSYRFPLLIIVFVVANLFVQFGVAVLVSLIPVMPSGVGVKLGAELIQTLLAAAIWIPYFMVSKRVKNTFVKVEPADAVQTRSQSDLTGPAL